MSEQNKILVINAGSSSIKFQLFNTIDNQFTILCKGLVERIAIKNSNFIIEIANGDKFIKHEVTKDIPNHLAGARVVIDALRQYQVIADFADIKRIGHRMVHGGQKFNSSIIIDDKVIAGIKSCIPLAPLHNPAALEGLSSFQELVSHAKHVAVFDTSFHTTLSEEKYLYSVPYDWYKSYEVRRYGFHGTSYRYILEKLTNILNKPKDKINTIICHLGNGASICAIKNGKSFNTSMGLTPLDGLIMGSRSGIIDPSIHGYMCSVNTETTIETITNDLNKSSGLLGISGHSSDLRDVLASSNDKSHQHHLQSQLAITMFVQRIANYIIQYANDLANNVDALVFTAGIGENSAMIRQLVIEEIKVLNLKLVASKNDDQYNDYLEISDKQSQIPIFKIRTNEELMICHDTYNLLKNI
ncbi:acetate kinase [Spiroplasma endosymbiont of Polydrusus pterygomalis]|uniref:acetate kinase n=1 Tax=Spiroplasma endosymbiont of Polydrusus pterygomalis TaxID=3139327 RepID=UPI003CCB6947